MVRLSASINVGLSLIGSLLLMGAVPSGQDAKVAINPSESPTSEIHSPSPVNEPQSLAESTDPIVRQRQQFLLIQGIFAAAVGISALALTYGVRSYSKQHQQQRIDLLRQMTREFENDPDIGQALKILDFEEYRSYQAGNQPGVGNQGNTFNVTGKLLTRALANDDDRQYQRALLENLSPDADNYESAMQAYYAETTVRDWFNTMLNSLEHFSHLVESRVFNVREVKPWLLYWVRLIADEKYRRNCDSRVYNQLYNYIHDHGFTGVRQLFEQFGYRILRTPYQADDFQGLKNIDHYSNRLALSAAKASMLVYQDIRYVLEILELWVFKTLVMIFNTLTTKSMTLRPLSFVLMSASC